MGRKRKVSQDIMGSLDLQDKVAATVEKSPKKSPKISKNSENLIPSHSLQDTTDEAHGNAENSAFSGVFVSKLSLETTQEELESLFSGIGPVRHALIVRKTKNGRPSTYAIVRYALNADAKRALHELGGSLLHGRKIKIDVLKARHRSEKSQNVESTIGDRATEDVTESTVEAETAKSITATDDQEIDSTSQNAYTDLSEIEQLARAKNCNRLIVRNLPWSVRQPEQLKDLFPHPTLIANAYIPRQKGGKMCGFGFAVFKSFANAQRARSEADGRTVDGRVLSVDWALPKDEYAAASVRSGTLTPLTSRVIQSKQRFDGDEDSIYRGSQCGSVEAPIDRSSKGTKGSDEVPLTNGDGDDDNNSSSADLDNSDQEADEQVLAVPGDEGSDESEASSDESIDTLTGTEKEQDTAKTRASEEFTVFVRNVSFETDEDTLRDFFSEYGKIMYAVITREKETERSKGTGFIRFFSEEDMKRCLRAAKAAQTARQEAGPDSVSFLDDSDLLNDDPSKFVLEGRRLYVHKAVDRAKLAEMEQSGALKSIRVRAQLKDKRRTFLIYEGMLSEDQTSPKVLEQRKRRLQTRKSALQRNPSLHVSLRRLCVLNLPKCIDAKLLRQLGRLACVEFAKEVKQGIRVPISADENARDRLYESVDGSKKPRRHGVIVQSKIITEDRFSTKSRGYGFLEFSSHRFALMTLRWLNGRRFSEKLLQGISSSLASKPHMEFEKLDIGGRDHKLIAVEFAIENLNVVRGREQKMQRSVARLSKGASAKASAELSAGSKATGSMGISKIVSAHDKGASDKSEVERRKLEQIIESKRKRKRKSVT